MLDQAGRQPMERSDIELLLFDLGGVLIHWDGIEPLRSLTGGRLSHDQARKFWLDSPAVRRFEKGRSTAPEFARAVVAELGLALTPQEFLARFASWDRGPFPGAVELLEQLRPVCRLACLSNNNEIHWPRLRDAFSFGRFFEHCYVSYEIHAAKPDLEAFEFVLGDLALPAQAILFFDDNPECVAAARAAGLQAEVTPGVEGVRKILLQRGILR